MEIFIAAARYYKSLKKAINNQDAANRLIKAELDLEIYLLKLKADLETLNSQLEELVDAMDPSAMDPSKEVADEEDK